MPFPHLERKLESMYIPGLPDGIFACQKSNFGHILEGLRMENAGIFYGQWKI
jgi:hypothetical protein